MICSQAFVKKSGSSFGTLIAFAFMNISKDLIGKNECNHKDIEDIIDIAIETIEVRGKTKIGDKTILDSLSFIQKNLKAKDNNTNYSDLFKSSTKEALNAFKGKKILIGRARMFEDKTKDLDDPGMFALCKLSEVF
jgi:dihydroxyacetone kinase-like protein